MDISAVMAEVEALLNKSIAAEGYVMPPVSNDPARYIDLSQIDFEALRGSSTRAARPSKCRSSGRRSPSSWRRWSS